MLHSRGPGRGGLAGLRRTQLRPGPGAPYPMQSSAYSGNQTGPDFVDDAQAAEHWKNVGNAAFAEKRYTEAVEAYTTCLGFKPDLAVVHANKAAAHIKLRQWAAAIDACGEAIRHDPRHMKAWKRRAEANYYLGNFAAVGPDADRALELDPSQKDLLKFKSKALKKMQEQQQGQAGAAAAGGGAAAGPGERSPAEPAEPAPAADAAEPGTCEAAEAAADSSGAYEAEAAAEPSSSAASSPAAGKVGGAADGATAASSAVNAAGEVQAAAGSQEGEEAAGDAAAAPATDAGQQRAGGKKKKKKKGKGKAAVAAANGDAGVAPAAVAQEQALQAGASPAPPAPAAAVAEQLVGQAPAMEATVTGPAAAEAPNSAAALIPAVAAGTPAVAAGVAAAAAEEEEEEEVSSDEELLPEPADPFCQAVALVKSAERMRMVSELPSKIEKYSQAISLVPGEYDWYLARGKAYLDNHQNRKAVVDCTVALRLMEADPTVLPRHHFPAYMRRAEARAVEGDLKGAVADLAAAVDCAPSPAEKARAQEERGKVVLRQVAAKKKAKAERDSRPKEITRHKGGGVVIEDITPEPDPEERAAEAVRRLEDKAGAQAAMARRQHERLQQGFQEEKERVGGENQARQERNAVRRERRQHAAAAAAARAALAAAKATEAAAAKAAAAAKEERELKQRRPVTVITYASSSEDEAPAAPAAPAPARPAAAASAVPPTAAAAPQPPQNFSKRVPVQILEHSDSEEEGSEAPILKPAVPLAAAPATAAPAAAAAVAQQGSAARAPQREGQKKQQERPGRKQASPKQRPEAVQSLPMQQRQQQQAEAQPAAVVQPASIEQEQSQQPQKGRSQKQAAPKKGPQPTAAAEAQAEGSQQAASKPASANPVVRQAQQKDAAQQKDGLHKQGAPRQQGQKAAATAEGQASGARQAAPKPPTAPSTTAPAQQQSSPPPRQQTQKPQAAVEPTVPKQLSATELGALKDQGDAAFTKEDHQLADELYSRFLAQDACDQRVWSNRALNRLAMGRHAEALADCTAALGVLRPTQQAPKHKLLVRRATALQGLGHYEEAQRDLDEALQVALTTTDRKSINKKIADLAKTMERAGCALQPSGGALPPEPVPASSVRLGETAPSPGAAAPPAVVPAPRERAPPASSGSKAPAATPLPATATAGKARTAPAAAASAPAAASVAAQEAAPGSYATSGSSGVLPQPAAGPSKAQQQLSEESREEGNALFKAGKWREAVRKYETALRYSPACEKAHANCAAALLQLGDWRQAETHCSLALDAVPCYAKAYLRRAQARRHMEDFAGAYYDLQVANDLQPNDPAVQKELSLVRPRMQGIPISQFARGGGGGSGRSPGSRPGPASSPRSSSGLPTAPPASAPQPRDEPPVPLPAAAARAPSPSQLPKPRPGPVQAVRVGRRASQAEGPAASDSTAGTAGSRPGSDTASVGTPDSARREAERGSAARLWAPAGLGPAAAQQPEKGPQARSQPAATAGVSNSGEIAVEGKGRGQPGAAAAPAAAGERAAGQKPGVAAPEALPQRPAQRRRTAQQQPQPPQQPGAADGRPVLHPQSSNSQQGGGSGGGAAGAKGFPPAPRCAADLEGAIARLEKQDPVLVAKWLRGIPPTSYPQIVKEEGLLARHLEGMARLLLRSKLAQSDPAFVQSTLQGLAGVQGFGRTASQLSPSEKAPLRQLVSKLEQGRVDVGLLRREYRLL